MSSSIWDIPLASADGQLLTNEECYLLLDAEFSDDLLKTFPTAPRVEVSAEFSLQDEGSLYPPSPPDTKPHTKPHTTDILQQIDHTCKQENILSSWLEEKVDLPMFDGMTQMHDHSVALPEAPVYAPQPTEELLREFETVYGAVELTHLTPPQSPPNQPGPATQLLLSYAQQAQCSDWPAPDIQPEQLLTSGDSSPRSSDSDWSPHPSQTYSRGVDRRSRKKEQNKNAATRYRQKKKAEIEVLLGEEHNLRRVKSDLGTKRADLQREIRYLKGLMRELFKAKGLIK